MNIQFIYLRYNIRSIFCKVEKNIWRIVDWKSFLLSEGRISPSRGGHGLDYISVLIRKLDLPAKKRQGIPGCVKWRKSEQRPLFTSDQVFVGIECAAAGLFAFVYTFWSRSRGQNKSLWCYWFAYAAQLWPLDQCFDKLELQLYTIVDQTRRDVELYTFAQCTVFYVLHLDKYTRKVPHALKHGRW